MFVSSKWKRDRNIAHWVLEQLLSDSIKIFGSDFLIHPSGRIAVNRNGKAHYFEASELRLEYLQQTSNHSAKAVLDAVNLLLGYEHIKASSEPLDSGIEKFAFQATPLGISAYTQKFYQGLIDDKQANWPNKYWWFIPLVAFILGLFADEIKKILP
jgi:hypothetical protein